MIKVFNFIRHIIENKYLLYQLTVRDLTSRYKSSRMGLLWSIIEPMVLVAVLYLVFGLGLRGGRSMEMPFLCYLISGMAVVRFFTQLLNSSTVSIKKHAYLITKINFRLSILPLVTVINGIIDHLLFMVPVIIVFLLNGILPNMYWLQTIYYMFCLSLLLLGFSWFISAAGVFIPDLQHMVTVVSRILFYFTPVFWNADMFSPHLQQILKINPLYYIAMGYRESMYYQIPFWQHPVQTIYFWCWIITMLVTGTYFFRKLSPQFADYI